MTATKKRFLLLIISGIFSINSLACGGGDWEYKYSYYNFFNQYLLANQTMHPFLHCPYEAFCVDDDIRFDENAIDWQHYFNDKPSLEDVNLFIYKSDIDDCVQLQNLINGVSESSLHDKLLLKNTVYKHLKKHKKENVLAYLIYAKKCENLTYQQEYSWQQGEYYDEQLPQDPNFFANIIEEGIELYKNEKDKYLKARYGFQLVRLAHYSFQFEKSVDFFNKYVENLKTKNYIYYRALEQKAGALRGLDRNIEANVDFITVFTKLADRRMICVKSLKINDQNMWDNVASRLTDPTVLNFIRAFKNGEELFEMEQISNHDPNSVYLDVLMLRYLNKAEAVRFSRYNNPYSYGFESDKLEQFNQIVSQVNNKRNNRDDLWVLAESYSNLFINKFDTAQILLKTISSSSNFYEQAQILDFITRMESNKDSLSLEMCNEFYVEFNKSETLKANSSINDYIFQYFSNYYTSVGDKVAAGLCVNAYDFTWNRYSLMHINYIRQFELFFNKEKPNALEKHLIKKAPDALDDLLNEMRGTYYMQTNQLKKAYKEFKKLPNNFKEEYFNAETKVNYGYENDGFPLYDAAIFSGAVRHYFSSSYTNLCDNTHLKFNFLKVEDVIINKTDLLRMIIQIENKALKKDKNTAYYYYMLGNVWYNLGPEGWYKQILQFHYNVDESRNSKFFNYMAKFDVDIPLKYYELALENTSDRELEAKIHFMMAKTVQYAEQYPQLYFDSFLILNNEYRNTNYFKEVIKECTYFDRYVNPEKYRD